MGSDNKIVFDRDNVSQVISEMNIRKATGPGGLGGKVLKICHNEMAGLFTEIFQVAMSTHRLPGGMKNLNQKRRNLHVTMTTVADLWH